MKSKTLFLLITALLFSFSLSAQEKDTCKHKMCVKMGAAATQINDVRYNQYGVAVNRLQLSAEDRDGILVFEAPDQSYKLWFDNRVQVDGATFFGNDKNFDKIGDGVSIRRARFAVKAKIQDWYGELDMDFANGVFELKDAVISYFGVKNFEFTAGNFKEGFSMEETTTSRYLPFIERPMVVNTFAPSRHIGIQATYSNKAILAIAGVHFQSVEDSEIRTNVEDNNKDYGRNTGHSFTGKLVYMPFYDKQDYGLHFGAAASYRVPKSDMATSEYGGVRYSTRNGTSINRKKYLDTDVIPNVDHDFLYGFELAGFYKGLRFQSEYIGNNTYIENNGPTYKFNGWYAYVGYLLFGGHQRYNTAEGEFTQPSRGHKWGDVEVLGRYEYLTLNSKNIYGGSGQAYTLGLTYYITNNVKIEVNYQYNDNDRYANGKGKLKTGYDASGNATSDYTKIVDKKGKGGVDYNMLAMRFEVDF
ncbi:MAG TPA: porin [Candidatus Egerieousia sp.]|nr:porin [Candidatus Egerieousia sp.]